MDHRNCCMCAHFLPYALALRHYTSYHKKRNPQPEMDSTGISSAYRYGASVVWSGELDVSGNGIIQMAVS